MRIRFQADADLNKHILRGVLRQEPLVDFLSAKDGGVDGLDDTMVLAVAAASNRVLVSHDLKTMPAHFYRYIGGGASSPGVLLIAQSVPIGAAIEELLLVWEASTPEECAGRVRWIMP